MRFALFFYLAPNTNAMLRSVLRVTFFCLLHFAFFFSYSQKKLPNTLLWRISGGGLQNPSYLFGTMHLQDKRLFHFGDSLYRALQATDGYAMEINPQEFIDSIVGSGLRKEEDALLQRQKVSLNRKKLSKAADSLLQSVGIKGDVATKKELKKLRDRRMAKFLQQGEMPTLMDAYLFGLARRLGKWTGGIEDVADQLNLSDELGGALEPEAVLAPEAAMNGAMEQMTQIYLSQNLARIDSFSNGSYTAGAKDEILLHRNVKMAFRMDSLAHRRPTFFTVGAAHLPGDSGVISLLQGRGFSVEPVFSSATRFAGDFAATLPPAEWDTIRDAGKAYTVSMPGPASDYSMLGNLFKMKMCFDMTTMTVYMTGAVTDGQVGPAMLEKMLKGAAQNMTGKDGPVNAKTIEAGGLTGKEATIENGDGTYRLRLLLQNKTVYLLMAGAAKKSNSTGPDAERFFSSFVPGEAVANKAVWQSFSLPEKAFSVSMPGKPERAESIDKNMAEQSNWHSVSYNAVDAEKGVYYFIQVREPNEGYVIESDSLCLEQTKTEYKGRVDNLLSSKYSTYQSYPALFMDGYVKKADAVYKTMHVTRGNRVYSLIAGFPKRVSAEDAERFLASFTLLRYAPSEPRTEAFEGFSTTLPAALRRSPPDSTQKTSRYSAYYECNNATEAVVYQVFKQVCSPTYWAKSDSVFFEGKLNQYKGDEDSVVKKEWVQNGPAKGMEAVLRLPGWNGVKRLRFLVNGDTLYTLYSVIPRQDTGSRTHNAFFADFRIGHKVPPTICTNKAESLFAALRTGDSAAYADAASNLSLVTFDRNDLPLLHQALLQPDRGDDQYESVSATLIKIVGGMADSSTVDFIEKNYTGLSGDKAARQYNLLAVLAHCKTAASYAVLKKLLLTGPPVSGDAGNMRYALFDSLQLTASLYPELLQKSSDSLLGYSTITLANHLVDSGLLEQSTLRNYADAIVDGAGKAEGQLRNEEERWSFTGWSEMLGHLNSTAGNNVLRKALVVKENYIKQSVLLALLQNHQQVPAEAIAKVAADKGQRGYFYSELKKRGKEALFPAVYASQKSLAESELYAYLSDDYGDFTLTYLAEKVEFRNGKKSRYYLFKIRMAYNDEEKKQAFLGVTGPYDVTAKDKTVDSADSGFYAEEELTPANMNRLFKAYLQDRSAAGK